MRFLKRFLENPFIHLFIGLLMLITSVSEAWGTLAKDLKNLDLGTHHTIGMFGLVYALKSLIEVLEKLSKTSDAVANAEARNEKEKNG